MWVTLPKSVPWREATKDKRQSPTGENGFLLSLRNPLHKIESDPSARTKFIDARAEWPMGYHTCPLFAPHLTQISWALNLSLFA